MAPPILKRCVRVHTPHTYIAYTTHIHRRGDLRGRFVVYVCLCVCICVCLRVGVHTPIHTYTDARTSTSPSEEHWSSWQPDTNTQKSMPYYIHYLESLYRGLVRTCYQKRAGHPRSCATGSQKSVPYYIHNLKPIYYY